MPFPFLPFGALLAAAVLATAFALFGGLLKLLDRAALTARSSIAPGIVAGMRTWGHRDERAATVSPGAMSVAVEAGDSVGPSAPVATLVVEELTAAAVATERVHRR